MPAALVWHTHRLIPSSVDFDEVFSPGGNWRGTKKKKLFFFCSQTTTNNPVSLLSYCMEKYHQLTRATKGSRLCSAALPILCEPDLMFEMQLKASSDKICSCGRIWDPWANFQDLVCDCNSVLDKTGTKMDIFLFWMRCHAASQDCSKALIIENMQTPLWCHRSAE